MTDGHVKPIDLTGRPISASQAANGAMDNLNRDNTKLTCFHCLGSGETDEETIHLLCMKCWKARYTELHLQPDPRRKQTTPTTSPNPYQRTFTSTPQSRRQRYADREHRGTVEEAEKEEGLHGQNIRTEVSILAQDKIEETETIDASEVEVVGTAARSYQAEATMATVVAPENTGQGQQQIAAPPQSSARVDEEECGICYELLSSQPCSVFTWCRAYHAIHTACLVRYQDANKDDPERVVCTRW